MTPQGLLELLHCVLRDEIAVDALFVGIDQANAQAPDVSAAFLRELDELYSRNEIHFDLYLRLKDRLLGAEARTTPPAAVRTTPPAAAHASDATLYRVPTSPATSDRTLLRQRSTDPSVRPTHPRTGTRTGPGPEPSEIQTRFTEQPLEPGSVIKNRFVLEQRLGEGGMGVVFKARDRVAEEARDRDPHVALKFLSAEFRRHPEAFMALQRESRRAQKLAHPNVITVHDFDRDGTLIYMQMELLEGEPLDRFIQRHPQGLRFKEAWPIIEGCSRALAYAHEQGVIHADFKPGNVFIIGSSRKVKVLDFGIARALTRQGEDRAVGTRFDAGTLGALTPAYASPEMLLSEEPDPRDDVYALACVAYELLTGRHPYNGVAAVKAAHDDMTVKRAQGLGRRQHRALARGLAFRQNERSPSVQAFLDEMAGPLGARGRALRQLLVSTTGTGILVAAIAAGAWWLTRANPDEQLKRQLMEHARAQFEETRRQTGEAPVVDTELRDILLEQGRDYLQLAGQNVDPVVLSEGVSSAYGAFTSALKIDATNTAAAEGIVQIVRIYETEARRQLDAGNAARARELAGYALKIQPTRESLLQLKASADAQLQQTG